MAKSSTINFLALILAVSALSAAARPCKTLFFFSTTTTYYPITDSSSRSSQFQNPRSLTLFFSSTRIREFSSSSPDFFDQVDESETDVSPKRLSSSMIPLELYSSVSSSIRDRTKDIMSVVGALLFGVGCGALTAATMYLIWSLFWPHSFDFEDSDDEFDDDEKMKVAGYVAIPSPDDDLKKPAAKEVV